MKETLTFHFEGGLADLHKMNFYEASRFQYAAARLIVKLSQFRQYGRFVQKITNNSNFNIQLISQSSGSFNINVEDEPAKPKKGEEQFLNISLSDLIAYISERVVGKIDDSSLDSIDSKPATKAASDDASSKLNELAQAVADGSTAIETLRSSDREVIKRRVAELSREQRLSETQDVISRIDFARSQKLIAMSAPLISEMATALRRSAKTLEIASSKHGAKRPVLFLDQEMAQEIETATVDSEITPILGDITQFNKDNGWGRLKVENGSKIISFSIPSDVLSFFKQTLIDNMKKDLVYLQTYCVRDRSGEIIRLIVVGVLPTPQA